MRYHGPHNGGGAERPSERRLLPDGGTDDDGSEESSEAGEAPDDETTDRSNVDVMEPGEAEPADPKWEPPDIDDIPEFEVRADDPVVEQDTSGTESTAGDTAEDSAATPDEGGQPSDPTAGMPNDAQAPGATAVSSQGTEAYVAALELCARLPDDVRLPEEAPDLVPAAVEAELEEDIGNFAAAEFGTARPHVDALAFEEADGDVWLRIRIGVPSESFADIDPEEIRTYALQELEGVL